MKIWYNYFNIRTKELSMLTQQNILKYLTEHKQEFQIKEDIELYFKTSVDIIQLRERMNEFLKKRIERDVIYV